jgi:CheY-like chemotaxis protein
LTVKKTVVLVDDDNDVLTVLKKSLELNNYEVYDFDDPVKALDYLKSVNSPLLLITDIRMPQMTGFELVREVKRKHPKMSIIALTSFEINKSEFERLLPSSKIDALVNKPVSMNRFLDAVKAIMASKISEE